MSVHRSEFDAVPAATEDAVPDEHFLDLTGASERSLLPRSYMPPPMPGAHPGWMRLVAWVVITLLLSATAAGICLTYGIEDALYF